MTATTRRSFRVVITTRMIETVNRLVVVMHMAHMKVLRGKVALEIHLSKIFLYAYPAELIMINAVARDMRHHSS